MADRNMQWYFLLFKHWTRSSTPNFSGFCRRMESQPASQPAPIVKCVVWYDMCLSSCASVVFRLTFRSHFKHVECAVDIGTVDTTQLGLYPRSYVLHHSMQRIPDFLCLRQPSCCSLLLLCSVCQTDCNMQHAVLMWTLEIIRFGDFWVSSGML